MNVFQTVNDLSNARRLVKRKLKIIRTPYILFLKKNALVGLKVRRFGWREKFLNGEAGIKLSKKPSDVEKEF